MAEGGDNLIEKRAKLLREKRAFLFNRQRAYVDVLGKDNPGTRAILEDLKKFCRHSESTFHADPRAHALLEGRREVLLRILDHLELSSEELWKKYSERKGANQ